MPDATARLSLPLIAPGQAQKEVFHNEALTLIDAALHAVVVAIGLDVPPAAPAMGACWIVGESPQGDWAGRAQALAAWTEGGWRFVAPVPGMTVWLAGDSLPVTYDGAAWRTGVLHARSLVIGGMPVVGARQAAIPDPAGGTVIDSEARNALSAALAALRAHGLIGSN